MLISERIYKLLSEKGMSQKEFCEKTGISQSTVSDWRRKKTNPSADKILIICEILGVSPYQILSGTENSCLDYVVIDKQSKEFQILENYRRLNSDAQKRMEGYMKALKDLQQD